MSASPVSTPAFRQARSTGPTRSHAAGSVTSKPVVEIERLDRRSPRASSRARIARPSPPSPPGDDRLHGSSTTLPTWRRDSISACASSASASGKRRADERVDLALRPQREQLVDAAAHELGLVLHQPAEIDALDARVAADEPLHARIGPEARRRSRSRRAARAGLSSGSERVKTSPPTGSITTSTRRSSISS